MLRYWSREFVQLKPMKRRGNRRYYQHHEVLLIRRIRELLYDQGFTISGARNQLAEQGGVMAPRWIWMMTRRIWRHWRSLCHRWRLQPLRGDPWWPVRCNRLSRGSNGRGLGGLQLDLSRLDADAVVSLKEALLKFATCLFEWFSETT